MILTYATCFQHIDLVIFHFCLFVQIVLVEVGGMMTSTMDKAKGLWIWEAIPPPLVETDNINRSSSSLPNKNGTFNLVNIEKLESMNALIG
jgi:cytochrome b561